MYNNTTAGPLDYNIIFYHIKDLLQLGRFDVSDDRSVERMNAIILDVYRYIIIIYYSHIPAAVIVFCTL